MMSYLEKSIKKIGVNNISLHKPVQREELLKIYKSADFLFIHLNDYSAFEKVLPSKIFEIASTDKYIIAGVKGYARKFLNEEVEHAFIFDPCNSNSLIKFLLEYKQKEVINREEFTIKYSRKKINKRFSKEILSFLN